MMSNLDKLINKLCPDGVDYIAVGSVLNYEQPTNYIVNSTDYNDEFSTPVLTAGQTFILGYTNEKNNLYVASKDNPVIIFDDFTGAFKWVDFPFKVKSSAMKMLTTKSDNVILRYIFHIMGNINYSSDEHKRLWISIYSDMKIPLPPLPVQSEIIRVLDNFTELMAGLTAELAARKKQYSYYKELMLNFDESVLRMKVSDVLVRTKGTKITAQQMKELHKENGEVRIFAGGKTVADVNCCDIPNKDINYHPSIIVKSRGNIEFEYYEKPFSHKNEFWSYYSNNENVNIKFVYYYLSNYIAYFQNIANNMQMPQISIPVTDKYLIPIPSISEQDRIVNILECFDILVNDIKQGLPAEIAARQKQYEYYRDKLLTFKEVGNESI